tara:strand:- start:1019 stop:1822 length:804 start_codon:yes stop_codon:yes gene_type:complete
MNLINGKAGSSIKIFDRGFLYGDAIFETILVKDKRPRNLKLHLERLNRGIKNLKIKNFNKNLLQAQIKKALKDQTNCILGINISRGVAKKRGYDIHLANAPNIIITTTSIPKYPNNYYTHGINTKFSKIKLIKNFNLDNIKHCNRIDNILATQEISKKYPEVILCDEKENIIEGTASNIFFVKNDKLFTPKLINIGIDGVMKNVIINILKKNKISIKSLDIKKNSVNKFDAAFFCNSIRQIWNIKSIDGMKYNKNTLIIKLQELLNE